MPALSNATPWGVLGCLFWGCRQAAAVAEPPLGSLLATGLTDTAGTWAPQVMQRKSSPAPVYSRLHWAAPNRCKWYFLQRNGVSTGELIYTPAETLGLTLAQMLQGTVSSKLSKKGFLDHADIRPCSKKTGPRGPLNRYRLKAELRTKTRGCTPERESRGHHPGLRRERRHEPALWEQQRWAAPHGQANHKPRVKPEEAMPLLAGLRPARSECWQQLQARRAVSCIRDPEQKDTVQKAGLEISYNMDLSSPSRK